MNQTRGAHCRRAAIALMVVLVGFGLSQRVQAAQPVVHVPVGSPAPEFSLTTVSGQHVQLSDFRGQPLIINFFASWCAPCHEEAPLVRQMAKQARTKGYSVLGVAIRDARKPLTQFMQRYHLKFPVALDIASKVSRAYWVLGPPVTYFIDSRGIIRYKVVGPLTAADVRKGLASVSSETWGGDRPHSVAVEQ